RAYQGRAARDVSCDLREVGGIAGDHVIRDDVAGAIEPEVRERGEHAALVGDEVGKHDVEYGDAIARDHEQRVQADLEELAHLAGVEVRQPADVHARSSPMSSSASNTRLMFARARFKSKHASSRGASSVALTSGSAASRSRKDRSSCQARIALRCTMR